MIGRRNYPMYDTALSSLASFLYVCALENEITGEITLNQTKCLFFILINLVKTSSAE